MHRRRQCARGSASARWATGAALLGLSACPAKPPGEEALVWVDLVDNQAWVSTEPEDDPWPAHRPAEVDCSYPFGWHLLLGGEVEAEMLTCGYLSLSQPTRYVVPAGSQMTVAAYHFDLAAPEAANAHLAVMAGSQVLWEQSVPIPGGEVFAPGAVYQESFVVEQEIRADQAITLHMHNHGQNSYVFVHLQAELPESLATPVDTEG